MPDLHRLFEQTWGAPPTARVDAPGRVNLMGDHIDYNGLGVLPMALDRRVTLLVRPRPDSTVRIASTAQRFPLRTFSLGAELAPFAAGDWGNYAKAAATVLVGSGGAVRGMDALAHSTIPIAAGLSSSSALVVAFALGLHHANGRGWGVLDLAERLAVGERYVGTEGGGMDQAICLGARAGSACRIDFRPLRLECHRIPADWAVLVAFSGVHAEKSGRARAAYNARAAECRAALAGVNDALGLTAAPDWRELLAVHGATRLLSVAGDSLPEVLQRRFRHVVSEADRVTEAEAALERASLPDFGRLLRASHSSLAHDYEVSVPELDEMVEIAESAGAAGARLTGAGFGGCIVALTTAAGSDAVSGALRRRYYEARGLEGAAATGLFVARPGAGAAVTLL